MPFWSAQKTILYHRASAMPMDLTDDIIMAREHKKNMMIALVMTVKCRPRPPLDLGL